MGGIVTTRRSRAADTTRNTDVDLAEGDEVLIQATVDSRAGNSGYMVLLLDESPNKRLVWIHPDDIAGRADLVDQLRNELAYAQALIRSQDVGLMRACDQIDALTAEIDGLPSRHEFIKVDPAIGWMEGQQDDGQWCTCGRRKNSRVHRTAATILSPFTPWGQA